MAAHKRIGSHTTKKPSKAKIDFKAESVVLARDKYKKLLDELKTDDGVKKYLDTAFTDASKIADHQVKSSKEITNFIVDEHPKLSLAIANALGNMAAASGAAMIACNSFVKDGGDTEKQKTEFERIRGAAAQTVGALEKTLEEIEKLASDEAYLKKVYADSRPETREIYQKMDYLFGVGQENVFGDTDPNDKKANTQEQLSRALCVPERHRIARWRYMLALADQAYNIGLTDNKTNDIATDRSWNNHHKLEMFSHLYAQLSLHPRGVDNECMPLTHQLRHNPAIHSLHVTALADKFFKNVAAKIDASSFQDPSFKKTMQDELFKMRQKIMLAALVHDLGESYGEISQPAILFDLKNPEDEKRFSNQRNEYEKGVFEAQIDHVHKKINKVDAAKIGDDDWQRIRKSLVESFGLAEKTTTFEGRFFKILERMQSQQDYLRFHGLNGANSLIDALPKNKEFTLNYVPELLFGSTDYATKQMGKTSLRSCADKEQGAQKQRLCKMLCDEVELEFDGPERAPNDNGFPGLSRLLATAMGEKYQRFAPKSRTKS